MRTEGEWEEAHIDGSCNIPLNQLPLRLAEVPERQRIVVHCASGYRSATAASILELNGRYVIDLVGGLNGGKPLDLRR